MLKWFLSNVSLRKKNLCELIYIFIDRRNSLKPSYQNKVWKYKNLLIHTMLFAT